MGNSKFMAKRGMSITLQVGKRRFVKVQFE